MRTTVREEITSFGTLLSTLCPEIYPRLDSERLRFRDSWRTRGFYERAATMCHRVGATPLQQLIWTPTTNRRWRIDSARTNRRFPPRTSRGPRRTA
jgi:hypothetical protein